MIRFTQINKQDVCLLTAEICFATGEGTSIECSVGLVTQEPRMIDADVSTGSPGGLLWFFIVAFV